jgi:hypothetical protein
MEKTIESNGKVNGTALPTVEVETSPKAKLRDEDKAIVLQAQRAYSLHKEALKGRAAQSEVDRIALRAASKAIFAALRNG